MIRNKRQKKQGHDGETTYLCRSQGLDLRKEGASVTNQVDLGVNPVSRRHDKELPNEEGITTIQDEST